MKEIPGPRGIILPFLLATIITVVREMETALPNGLPITSDFNILE